MQKKARPTNKTDKTQRVKSKDERKIAVTKSGKKHDKGESEEYSCVE